MEDWVVEVEQKLEEMAHIPKEAEKWMKRSIYRLPAHVTDLDSSAYKPLAASLGPYHHGHHPLAPMEEHKHRALLYFIKRSQSPLRAYLHALALVVEDLKDAYDQLDPKWLHDTEGFLKMMILDSCFILEILRMNEAEFSDHALNDPIFSNHGKLYILPILRLDMLLLENQVPLVALIKLLEVENRNPEPYIYVTGLIIDFYHMDIWSTVSGGLHLLDVYRKLLLQSPYESSGRASSSRRETEIFAGGRGMIPSASQLGEAGIRFKPGRFADIRDISFRGNTLRLPAVIVDDQTQSIFLNLIAFERFHVGAGNEVSSYAFMLHSLIKSSKDVSHLRSCGIVANALGTDEEVAQVFKYISSYAVVDPESSLDEVYRLVSKKLRNRFLKRLHEWQFDLIRTYFKSPWAVVSVIAAILLFTLTTIQTVYAVLSYNHQK